MKTFLNNLGLIMLYVPCGYLFIMFLKEVIEQGIRSEIVCMIGLIIYVLATFYLILL